MTLAPGNFEIVYLVTFDIEIQKTDVPGCHAEHERDRYGDKNTLNDTKTAI